MNSRERVIASVNHKKTDRVPVCFGGHRSSGISAIAYEKLREHLGLEKKELKVYDVLQQLAVIDEDVLEIFQIDTIEMGRGFALAPEDWQPWIMPNGHECLIPAYIKLREGEDGTWFLQTPSGIEGGRMNPGMLYFDQFRFPLKERRIGDDYKLEQALSDIVWSNLTPPDLNNLADEDLKRKAEAFYSSTDRAVIGLHGGSFFETCQFLFGADDFLMKMVIERDYIESIMDDLLNILIKTVTRFIRLVGNSIDIIVVSDDLGMHTGPIISPEMYRDIIKPRHKEFYSVIKKLSDAKILMHSCGGIEPLYNDLIEIGVDAHNPVQISCNGMEPGYLKKKYGENITFWGGGCDTKEILPNGTPSQIREHVLHNLEIFAENGGFVFQQVHNIMADVPPENIVAMFNAVKEFNGINPC